MEKYVRRISNLDTYYVVPDGRAGVRKTGQNTQDYQIDFEDMLIKRQMMFSNILFTVSKGHDAKSILTEFRNQLERYHWEIEYVGDPSKGNFKTHMTGKMGGAQDDLYIAAVMVVYWGHKILRDTARLNSTFFS